MAAAKAAARAGAADDPQITAATFSSVLGAVSYAAVCTRTDFTQAVNALARESAAPSSEAILGLRRVVRYLSHTREVGLTFTPQGPQQLVAYCDADWAGCTETQLNNPQGNSAQ
jgi:hypothetical protein